MSESQPEQNIEADQVVVNNAEDGGGNDGDVKSEGDTTEGDTTGDEAQQDTGALKE